MKNDFLRFAALPNHRTNTNSDRPIYHMLLVITKRKILCVFKHARWGYSIHRKPK